jgi:hypothetical protein
MHLRADVGSIVSHSHVVHVEGEGAITGADGAATFIFQQAATGGSTVRSVEGKQEGPASCKRTAWARAAAQQAAS